MGTDMHGSWSAEDNNSSRTKPVAQDRGWHPALPAVLFLLLALTVPFVNAKSLVNADGDPARHLRHGETILSTGDVIRADPFSFSRPGQPFVGFEWGSQVLLALSYRLGGTVGMVALTALLISAAIAFLLWWLLWRGLDPLLALTTAISVAVLTNIHWLARPHIVSWLPLLVLLAILEDQRRAPLWLFFVLFALWANLHGGFLYGIILIGMYLTGHLLEAWTHPETRATEIKRARWLGTAILVAAASTFVNPYGWRLPWHVIEFFRDPTIRDMTVEFLSPDFHQPPLYPFLLALLIVILILARGPRLRWPHLVVLAGNVVMALMAQRNIVLFALTTVPIMAGYTAVSWEHWVGRRGFARRFAVAAAAGRTAPYIVVPVTLLVLLAVSRGRVFGRQLVPEGFDPTRMPVAAVDQARSVDLKGRIFHEFAWGGYLLWAWPEQKVFIDGGTDFYGGDLMRSQRAVINLRPGWRDSLTTWRIDLVLVSAGGSLAAELAREPDWRTFHRDSTAVLFTRSLAGDSLTKAQTRPR